MINSLINVIQVITLLNFNLKRRNSSTFDFRKLYCRQSHNTKSETNHKVIYKVIKFIWRNQVEKLT